MQNVIQQIQELYPSIQLSRVELPQDHTLNDMWINYGIVGVYKLFTDNTNLISVNEPKETKETESVLQQINEGKIAYLTSAGTYYVMGELSTDLATLKASLNFEEKESKRKYRIKIDLFDRTQLLSFCKLINEAEHIDIGEIEAHLLKLTDLLEAHREQELEKHKPNKSKRTTQLLPQQEKEAIEFLSQKNLINAIDKLIEKSGVTGEISNRKITFIIASTYKMLNPLHGLIQGTSGSGKTHLINAIASLMPPEDILNMTRVTSKSFYHYQKDELINKVILIQDMDGLDEEAKYAFREMQSAGMVSSSTTYKDKSGHLVSMVKTVNANFASLAATTHAEIYFDNMSRSIVIGIDESAVQTQLIIEQQNKKTAGLMDEVAARKAKELLQNCMRTLKPYEVVNRYADKLMLPVEAKMLRRLNNHYQSFVAQITILHQYQRKKDEQGRLIATVEDLKLACEILFDAIMWKIDELDSSLRQVFEQMKQYVQKQSNANLYRFTAREIRQQFNLSKSQSARYMEELRKLEYIQAAEGTANKGFKYKIAYWDNMQQTRAKVKADLMQQLRRLE